MKRCGPYLAGIAFVSMVVVGAPTAAADPPLPPSFDCDPFMSLHDFLACSQAYAEATIAWVEEVGANQCVGVALQIVLDHVPFGPSETVGTNEYILAADALGYGDYGVFQVIGTTEAGYAFYMTGSSEGC